MFHLPSLELECLKVHSYKYNVMCETVSVSAAALMSDTLCLFLFLSPQHLCKVYLFWEAAYFQVPCSSDVISRKGGKNTLSIAQGS